MRPSKHAVKASALDTERALRGYQVEQRLLHLASGILSAAVLGDSAVEHYRGSFRNPMMYAALGSAALSLLANVDGAQSRPVLSRTVRRDCHVISVGLGLIGTGFHIYNLVKRPGRINLNNLFYGAPIGAPAALALAGFVGVAAENLQQTRPWSRPTLLGAPSGRALAATTAIGLIGTIGEVAFLHFRGTFQNPFMYVPVSMPPIAAGLMARAAIDPRPLPRPVTRFWLKATAIVGLAGSAFHAYGISRAMGGWRNWRQNLVSGPPLPAPPSFTGLAVAGLAALRLIERGCK
jgi:hypothetical protein